jgi:dihydroneopterin aldolase
VIERVVSTTSYALLEALVEHLATELLAADPRIDSVTLAVRKLRPPVAQQLSTSGVRVSRVR